MRAQAHGFVVFLKIPSKPIRGGSSLDGGRLNSARNRVSDLISTFWLDESNGIPKLSYIWVSSKFQTDSSQNIVPYSAFVCPILKTKLALFRDTDRKRKPERQRKPRRALKGRRLRTQRAPCLGLRFRSVSRNRASLAINIGHRKAE